MAERKQIDKDFAKGVEKAKKEVKEIIKIASGTKKK